MKTTFTKQAFLFVMATILLPVWGYAQPLQPKLHMIIVAETSDQTIGAGKDFVRMQEFAKRVSLQASMTLEDHYYKKHEIGSSDLTTLLSNISISSNDAVWFYFTGHGFNEQGSAFTGFPLQGTKFTMDYVHGKLKAKNPRLLITMYDACNWHDRGGLQLIAGRQDDEMKFGKLFKKSKGEIKIASNTAGHRKYSYGSAEYGGFFTTSFLNTINEAMEDWDYSEVTWDKILQHTKTKTTSYAKQRRKDQVPHYEAAVSVSANDEPVLINTPENGEGLKEPE